MATKNQIILNDIIHEFVQDKPNLDMCWSCSLKDICFEKMGIESQICKIFINDNINNGHFVKI